MNFKKFCITVVAFFIIISQADAQILGREYLGSASFYAKMFHGRTTSCGEKFSNNDFTAAHRSLPFNTMLEVTNLANKKTITVRVNDRGPYKKGRILDLSYAAAQFLEFTGRGVAKVRIRVVGMEGMILLGRNEIITDMGEIIERLASN